MATASLGIFLKFVKDSFNLSFYKNNMTLYKTKNGIYVKKFIFGFVLFVAFFLNSSIISIFNFLNIFDLISLIGCNFLGIRTWILELWEFILSSKSVLLIYFLSVDISSEDNI